MQTVAKKQQENVRKEREEETGRRPLEIFSKVLQLWDSGDIEGGISYYEPSCDVEWPGAKGLEQCEALLRTIYGAFPDGKNEIIDSVESGDASLLGIEVEFTGTHAGTLVTTATGQKVPPTGKKMRLGLGQIVRFKGGRIVYHHAYWDRVQVYEQLGLTGPGKER